MKDLDLDLDLDLPCVEAAVWIEHGSPGNRGKHGSVNFTENIQDINTRQTEVTGVMA